MNQPPLPTCNYGWDTFSTSNSGLWPSDLDAVLSGCVEKVALTLCQWLDGSSASNGHRALSGIVLPGTAGTGER